MFNNLGDLKKLAEEAILIEHFASMKLITVQADEPAIEVLALMTADDFDVIPVVEGENWIGYIEKKDILSLTDNDRGRCISELQDKLLKPFDKAKFVDLDDKKANSLQMAFEHFNPPAIEWFFVGREKQIKGIVTFEDLGKPAVSLYLLAKLLMVESGLRRLWGTYTNNPTTDSPSKDGVDGDPKYFRDVLDKIETHCKEVKGTDKPNLLKDLGYKDVKELGSMNALRNELAHGRNILSFINGLKEDINRNKLNEAINRNKKIDELLTNISRLEDNRPQIWKAYESTNIVKRTLKEDFWVGSDTVDLPQDLLSSSFIYIISAENPSGEVLSTDKNEERTDALRNLLNSRCSKNNDGKWKYEEVIGQSPDGKWKQDSFAIGGIDEDEARKLAKMFGQRAFFELTQEYIRVISTDLKDKYKS
jgi:predicted transcriptional regulator